MSTPLPYLHRFEEGLDEGARPLLLLHGTGGDENDLVPLGRTVAPTAPLLSPRGNVLENGMPRFFRRLAEGVFDEDDVRRRADELADFMTQARSRYHIVAPVALGYSNGANIAAAILLLRPEVLAGAILLRATVPLSQTAQVDLTGVPVLVISGRSDPVIPVPGAAQLVSLLRIYGAILDHEIVPAGHEISQIDVVLARNWLRTASPRSSPAHDNPDVIAKERN
jgi:phospholipase/carboxylesterase